MLQKKENIRGILVLLTGIFVLAQIIILLIQNTVNGLGYFTRMTILAHLDLAIVPLLELFCAQLIVYGLFITFLWYLIVSIREGFSLKYQSTRYLTYFIWCFVVVTVLAANAFYAPQSFFSQLLLHNLFNDALAYPQLKMLVTFIFAGGLLILFFSGVAIAIALYRKQHLARHAAAFALLLGFVLLCAGTGASSPPRHPDFATADKPNIFIIAFDALRPDFLSYVNNSPVTTPTFAAFLNSAIVFKEAYTPLARTYPSWTTILTGKYPLHHHARDDNINVNLLALKETLATQLKAAGYETIYASDDNRFSYINKEFGFNHLIGNRGDVVDFWMNALNDFPLSNLLITTRLGKILFPYSYGNHASAFVYNPDNFLNIINDGIAQRDNKPLFLAMHLNVTAFPWHHFNDKSDFAMNTVDNYKESVRTADKMLKKLLANLNAAGLLNHAIIVLVSDHGMALSLPGDRNISEALYQGDKNNIHMLKTPYSSNNKTLRTASASSPNGIDTAFGYGGDILSLKETHALLAFKAYGVAIGPAHAVSGRSLFLDIAPTLLDILHLPPLTSADGLTLKTYLADPSLQISDLRPVYFESAFGSPEILHADIMVEHVITKNFSLFQISRSGMVTAIPAAEAITITKKQRGILMGDWLLAYYPQSIRYRTVNTNNTISYHSYTAPPYAVLLNIKTGKWTLELNNPFAKTAPLQALSKQLNQFYGPEMDNYRLTRVQ